MMRCMFVLSQSSTGEHFRWEKIDYKMQQHTNTYGRSFSHNDCENTKNRSPRLYRGGFKVDLNPSRVLLRAANNAVDPKGQYSLLPREYLNKYTFDSEDVTDAIDTIATRLKDPLGRREAAREKELREQREQEERERRERFEKEELEEARAKEARAKEAREKEARAKQAVVDAQAKVLANYATHYKPSKPLQWVGGSSNGRRTNRNGRSLDVGNVPLKRALNTPRQSPYRLR